jgi:hypothetical protein
MCTSLLLGQNATSTRKKWKWKLISLQKNELTFDKRAKNEGKARTGAISVPGVASDARSALSDVDEAHGVVVGCFFCGSEKD